jgi:hypothetical protein
MESESDSEAQDVLDFSKQSVLFAEYDDKAVTPAQQVKKGKLKGAGGGTASYPPVEGMVLEDRLSEAEGPTAACVSVCVVIRGPGQDVCGGCIGTRKSDGRFCWSKPGIDLTRCDRTSHASKLAGVKAGYAYIGVPPRAGPATTSAYLEPSYDLKSVVPETVQTIKRSEPRTVEAWSRILEGVCANPGMTREELTSMMTMVSRPVSFAPKTPAKKRSLSEDDVSPMSKRMSFEDIGKTEEDEVMETESRDEILTAVATNWKVFSKLMATVQGSVEKVGLKLETFEGVTLPSVEEKADRVHASLGTSPKDYDAPATSAWGCIAAVGAELKDQATSMLRLDTLASANKKTGTALGAYVTKMQTALVERMKELVGRVTDLEGSGSSRNASTQDVGARAQFEEEMLREISLGRARVSTLETKNIAMEARLGSESIKMGGVIFQSQADCQTWVMNNVCPADFYEFFDAISLLEQYKESTVPYSQMADMDTKTKKLGLTVTSHRVINSFSREVPLVFMSGPASADKPLTRIKTPKDWDVGDGQAGLKNEITKFLTGAMEGIEQKIDARFHSASSATARRVALDCLRESKDFIMEMSYFISEFYGEMTHSGVGKEDESWALTCKMIKVVFFELNLVRAVAQRACDIDVEETGRRVGLILWGTLRAHKLMREYLANKFRRHSTIAPCLLLHLFTTRPPAGVMKSLQAEVVLVTKTVKAAQVAAETALRLAKTAKQS